MRWFSWPVVALASVAVLVLAAVAAPAGSAAVSDEQRLEQARAKLERVREQIEAASEQREQRQAALAQAEARVADVLEAVRTAEMAVRRQQQRVDDARQRYQRLQAQATARRQAMARRAAELYRQGTGVPMTAVLASDSVDEAMNRSAYIEFVQRADRARFQEVAADQTQLDAQRELLQQEEAVLQRRLAQQQEILAQARQLREQRRLQLAGIKDKLDQLQSQERHLESESRQLAAMARRARQPQPADPPSQRAAGSGGGSGGGSGWTWPVSGTVTSAYGMRWGRMHEGIDVAAAYGTPLVAARSGTVSHAGPMGGYGNMVLIAHGGGITTAYAHMSSLAVSTGERVSTGQRIGAIGCSGSCTGPHTHFEVRVNGAPRNPRDYLP